MKWLSLVSGAMTALLTSCATIEPAPDYARTRQVIVERTGQDDLYDPTLDEAVDERVQQLLANGLSVDEAVSVALLNNKAFQASFYEIGVSRADLVQSGLLSNPSLGLGFEFPEGGGRSKITAGFAQQIVDLWQIPVRKQIAQAQLEQVILSAADQALRLRADVKSAYYQAMAAQQLEDLAAENLRLVEKSVGLAQARFEAGEVGLLEVNLVRVAMNTVQLEAISAHRAHEEAINHLGRLLGLSRTQPRLTLTADWPAVFSPSVEETDLLLYALDQRLDAAVAALKVKEAQASLEREFRNVFPNVTLGLDAERPESRGVPDRDVLADTARASIAAGKPTAPSIQSRSQRHQEHSQIVDMLLGPSLNITLPLWDQNQAQIAKAQYRVCQLRASYEDMLDAIAAEVTDALTALRSANELTAFYEGQAVPLARQNIEGAQSTYQAGEQSIVVLIDAQEALITERRGQIAALRGAAQAQVELERAIAGRIPDEWRMNNKAEPPAQAGGS